MKQNGKPKPKKTPVRRPTLGTGMAEGGAQAIESYRNRMKTRMGKMPKNYW